jgi:hypothetical protein
MPLAGGLVFGLGGGAPAPAPVVVTSLTQVDHVAAALDRLCYQFRDKQGIVDLVTVFAQRWNDLEAVFWALLSMRTVYTAVGAQLDTVGEIVGQPRNGLGDDDYRRFIFARIATNKSSGLVEDLITVAKLVLNDANATIVVNQQGAAAVVVRVIGTTISDVLANITLDFLQATTEAGIRCILETQYVADSDEWFFALAAFATGTPAIGNTSIAVDSTAGFPSTGSLIIDEGTASAETVTYTGLTPASFIGVSALVHNHVTGTCVSLATGPGKGMGDTSDLTVGGELAAARDVHYP